METDFRLVTIDTTEHWTPEIIEVSGRIFQTYLVDSNLHTHICSTTPMLWLHYIGWFCENEVDDDLWSEIYAAASEHGDYYNLSVLTNSDKPKSLDFDYANDEEYEEELADVLEYCQCNGVAEEYYEKYLGHD